MRSVLYAIVAVLVLTWLIGFVTSHSAGGLIHILPVTAIEFVVLQVIVGDDPV